MDLALLTAEVFGILMGSFNEQNGMSQMYYSLTAYVPGLLVGCRNISFKARKKSYRAAGICICSLLLLLQMKLYFYDEGVYGKVAQNAIAYVTDGLPPRKENDSDQFEYPINSIQYPEYEAMLWIRENTPKDSIIMPDKDVCKGQPGYMYYAAFAERQAYLEGDIYLYDTYEEERETRRKNISRIYLNDTDALRIAKEDGVDYIIQTKWVIPTYEGNGCTLVYENSMVRIWKINEDL